MGVEPHTHTPQRHSPGHYAGSFVSGCPGMWPQTLSPVSWGSSGTSECQCSGRLGSRRCRPPVLWSRPGWLPLCCSQQPPQGCLDTKKREGCSQTTMNEDRMSRGKWVGMWVPYLIYTQPSSLVCQIKCQLNVFIFMRTKLRQVKKHFLFATF